MAKQGMKRPEIGHRKNELPPVPQIKGKDFLDGPQAASDLAMDNLMDRFDMTAADLQDLQ